MSKRAHNLPVNTAAINALKLIGVDVRDLRPDRPWTPDADLYLIELYEQGIPVWDMAAETGRTQESITIRLIELGERERITPDMWGREATGPVPKGPLGVSG